MIAVSVVAAVVLVWAVVTVLFCHKHRWTAWEKPVTQRTGWPTQVRYCKDVHCNRYQIKEVRP